MTAARRLAVSTTPDALELRLETLHAQGFSEADADKVFEAILLPSPEVIAERLDNLRALGFADPVKMVTSSPALLSYSRERIALCGRIMNRLSDRADGQIYQLQSKRRALLDAIDAAKSTKWAQVREMFRNSKRSAA